jgi:hypothetical protein
LDARARPGPRKLAAYGAALAAVLVLSGCGTSADRDFCNQFADLVTAADEIQAQDPLVGTAEELRTSAEDFEAQLDQFQAVTEGRFDTVISVLRASVDGIRQAAVEASEGGLTSARPLLEDTLEDVDEAWANLQELAAVQCTSA